MHASPISNKLQLQNNIPHLLSWIKAHNPSQFPLTIILAMLLIYSLIIILTIWLLPSPLPLDFPGTLPPTPPSSSFYLIVFVTCTHLLGAWYIHLTCCVCFVACMYIVSRLTTLHWTTKKWVYMPGRGSFSQQSLVAGRSWSRVGSPGKFPLPH